MQRKVHQRHRAERLDRVADQDNPSPVVAVGDMTRCQHKEDSRSKQGQPGKAQVERRMRDLVHLPRHTQPTAPQRPQSPASAPSGTAESLATETRSPRPSPQPRSHPLPYQPMFAYSALRRRTSERSSRKTCQGPKTVRHPPTLTNQTRSNFSQSASLVMVHGVPLR